MHTLKQFNPKACLHFGSLAQAMLIVFLVRLLFAFATEPYTILADSYSYINFPLADFFHLDFSGGRTPIYPIIIRVCYFLVGETYFLNTVVALQSIASFCSVALLYQLCLFCCKQHVIAYIITVLYGISPSIHGWDNCILTESFALSGMICFLYLIVKYIYTSRFCYGASCIALLFVLTFLRPSFLIYNVLIFVFWIARVIFQHKEWKQILALCLCSCVSFALIFGYACIFAQSFGYLSISHPLPRQYLTVNITREYYLDSDNEAFTEAVLQALEDAQGDTSTAMHAVLAEFSDAEILEITSEYMKQHPLIIAADTLALAVSQSTDSFWPYYLRNDDAIAVPLVYLTQILEPVFGFFRVAHVYCFILLELLLVIVLWVKQKLPPWVHIGLFVFLASICVSSLIATSSEYSRTMICVLPLMYFSCTLLIEPLNRRFTKLLKHNN